MKIAIVINTSWNIYNFRLGLIKALQKEGHEIYAIAPHDHTTEFLIENGCKFIPIEIENKGSNPFSDLKLIFKYFKIYKELKPDFALQYTIKPNIYGSLAAKLANVKTINNVSGLGTVFLHNNLVSKIARFLYKIAFKFPEKVFFQNNDDRELFVKNNLVSSLKTDVLPGSGINLEKYKYSSYQKKSPFVFLVIARLIYDKGIVEFVEAAKILKAKGINAKFQILGFTDFETKLGIPEELLCEWIDNKHIEYLGDTLDVIPFLENASCVVLPSYREGTPKTLIEALAMAKPIVTTNVPGCKETVKDGQNGFLCEVKNSEDLADKLYKMYNLSENELQKISIFSRKYAEVKFNESYIFQKYLQALSGK